MTGGLWRRARRDDLDAVRGFAGCRETYAAGFSGRVRGANGGLALPRRADGGLFLHRSAAGSADLDAAVLFCPSGSVFPVFSGPSDGWPAMAAGLRRSLAVRSYSPGACIGLQAQADALESVLAWVPTLRVRYDAMAIDLDDLAGRIGPAAAAAVPAGLSVRRASAADLSALAPLAEAYDQEEVVTYLHRFDPEASRAMQARSLSRHTVYAGFLDGRLVARAQTNADGWARDQIGGVYVVPELRGRGIGGAVVSALLCDIAARGKGASLFVKKANPAARGLYARLGFRALGDFCVDYFS